VTNKINTKKINQRELLRLYALKSFENENKNKNTKTKPDKTNKKGRTNLRQKLR
jgi:acyl-CoA-binding protein